MRKNYRLGKFGISHYDVPKRDRQWKIERWSANEWHYCVDFFLGSHLYAFWYDNRSNR